MKQKNSIFKYLNIFSNLKRSGNFLKMFEYAFGSNLYEKHSYSSTFASFLETSRNDVKWNRSDKVVTL